MRHLELFLSLGALIISCVAVIRTTPGPDNASTAEPPRETAGKNLDDRYVTIEAARQAGLLTNKTLKELRENIDERIGKLNVAYKKLGFVVNNYAKTGFYLDRDGKFSGLPDRLELTDADKDFISANLADGVVPWPKRVE